MPLDQVGDVVRVTIAASFSDNQVQETNICYRCTATGGADTRALLGAAVYGYFVGNYAAVMSTQSSLYGWKVASINKLVPDLPATLYDPSTGAGGGTYVPSQARPILRLKTANAGRKYRGRMFLFSPTSGMVAANGYPPAALDTVINTLGAALIAAQVVGGSTWTAVIAHLVTGNPTGTTTTPVTTAVSARMFGTQRRSGNTGRLNVGPWS